MSGTRLVRAKMLKIMKTIQCVLHWGHIFAVFLNIFDVNMFTADENAVLKILFQSYSNSSLQSLLITLSRPCRLVFAFIFIVSTFQRPSSHCVSRVLTVRVVASRATLFVLCQHAASFGVNRLSGITNNSSKQRWNFVICVISQVLQGVYVNKIEITRKIVIKLE
jgi:hypothetical protein